MLIKFMVYFFVLLCSVSINAQVLTINEVMFDPESSDRFNEFIELINLSDSTWVDIYNWSVGDGKSRDKILESGSGLILAPGQYAVILDGDYKDSSTFYDDIIPDEALILTIDGITFGSGGLSNSVGEKICIYDETGSEISCYTYSVGNFSGYSDEKKNPYMDNIAENWEDSQLPGGTPGRQNTVFKSRIEKQSLITISPNPFSPDSDGIEDEAVIKYSLPLSDSRLTLSVYSLSGKLVKAFYSGEQCVMEGKVFWDGCDDYGSLLPSGVYIVYIESIAAVSGKLFSEKESIIIYR